MKVTPIVASTFVSDGGAMFGLVPKPIWSKLISPNERNGIPQNANCLLVELGDGRLGLVDTGCGPEEKFNEKERGIHGLSHGWPLEAALAARGLSRADIDFVVFTHLHWDHGGGASLDSSTLAFERATHFVHALEWEDATSGDPLLYRSYPEEVIAPLKTLEASAVQFVEDEDREILPGLRLVRSGGHTRGHCVVVIEDEDLALDHPDAATFSHVRKMVFAGDVCPMRHNLRMVFQTAYDTFPLETRAWKQEHLPALADSGTLLMFDHDPDAAGALLGRDERGELTVDTVLTTARHDLSA